MKHTRTRLTRKDSQRPSAAPQVVLVATRRVPPDEALSYDYGGGAGLSSADCLGRFGFVDGVGRANPHERAAVPVGAIWAAMAAAGLARAAGGGDGGETVEIGGGAGGAGDGMDGVEGLRRRIAEE